ncbi:unnamed protein product [Closterium sp. NIES-53]
MEVARMDAASGAQLRGEALHVHGPAELSSQDWLAYFATFNPVGIEWVSLSSCNVVFDDGFTCKRALLARRTALDDMYQGVPTHALPPAPWFTAKPISCNGMKLPCSIRAATIFDVRPSTGLPASVVAQLREKEEGAAKLRRGDGAGVNAGVGGGIFHSSSKQQSGRIGAGFAAGVASSNGAGGDGGEEGGGGEGGILDRALEENSSDAMEGVTVNGDSLSGLHGSGMAPRRARGPGGNSRGSAGRRVVDWDAPVSEASEGVVERFGTASEPEVLAAAAAAAVAKAVGMPVAPASAVIPGSMVAIEGAPPGAPLVALVPVVTDGEDGLAGSRGGGEEITEDLRDVLQKVREGKRKARPSVWERIGRSGGEGGEEGEMGSEGDDEDRVVNDGKGKKRMVRDAGGTNRLFLKSVASLHNGSEGSRGPGTVVEKKRPSRSVKQRLGSKVVVPHALSEVE